MLKLAPTIGMICVAFAVLHGNPLHAAPQEGSFSNVQCEGQYRCHLQGICTDDKAAIYWCFTDNLVKTNRSGKVLKQVPVAMHHGDLCHHEGKVYVAVNLGQFNHPKGHADSWVYVYDGGDLSELARHKVPEVFYGAGGIGYHDGHFLVIGGLPKGVNENYAYEYDQQFKFVKRHVIQSGYTLMGIQTATCARGEWWFGCYGRPPELLKTDPSFNLLGKYAFDTAVGIVGLPDGSFLVGRDTVSRESKKHVGAAILADADAQKGLIIQNKNVRNVAR